MPSSSADPHSGPEPDQAPDLHCVAVPASVDRLPGLRRTLTRWAASTGIAAERAQSVVLASYEALANAVAHAYPSHLAGVLDLHASYRPQHQRITITVADHGHWRTPTTHGDARLRPGGRGLVLIRALAELATIDTDDSGTVVRMTWCTT
jgi:serine/threonine-protein kinase RsbW